MFPSFSIRGRLGGMSLVFRNMGILIAYILGSTVEYKYIPCICVAVPIVFVIIISILWNTPQYYLHKGKPHVRSQPPPKKIYSNCIQLSISSMDSPIFRKRNKH